MKLIDSDVLIWALKKNPSAALALENASPFCISVVADIEVMQGVRDKVELRRWRRFLDSSNIEILHVTDDISRRAQTLVEMLALSHHMQLGDALVAATALQHGLSLVTTNGKHFRAVPGLSLVVVRP